MNHLLIRDVHTVGIGKTKIPAKLLLMIRWYKSWKNRIITLLLQVNQLKIYVGGSNNEEIHRRISSKLIIFSPVTGLIIFYHLPTFFFDSPPYILAKFRKKLLPKLYLLNVFMDLRTRFTQFYCKFFFQNTSKNFMINRQT